MSEERENRPVPSGYTCYRVKENQTNEESNNAEYSAVENQYKEALRRERRRRRQRNRIFAMAFSGIIFGLCAALTFFLAGKLLPGGKKADAGISRQETAAALAGEEISAGVPAVRAALTTEEEGISASIAAEKGIVAAVAQACMPSVVAISTVSIQEIPSYYGFYGWRTQNYKSASSGSGIIVGENEDELLIATNNHVVADATTVTVCFFDGDVKSAEKETEAMFYGNTLDIENAVSATIKGTDEANDLAVVSVNKADVAEETLSQLRVASLGDSDSLVVGEQVVAIGNALGYGQSLTSGWVSALNRTISTSDGGGTQLIQTDAAINRGNSGGALLNLKGELIGINTAKSSVSDSEGMGYAIPISMAYPILEDLMNRKTRVKLSEGEAGYLGVNLADLSAETIWMYDVPAGAFVAEAVSGGPAEAAGLRRGDIIEKVDGQKVDSRKELIQRLMYYAPGEKVDLVIARADSGIYTEQSITVTLGQRPDQT